MAKAKTAKKTSTKIVALRAKGKVAGAKPKQARQYMSQSDVPSCSLEQALRVPRAIVENYPSGEVTSLQLAVAMNIAPTSGAFRMLCGAAIAYGLTEGGCFAELIVLQPLGKRTIRPTTEGEDLAAKRKSILKPRVLGEFLQKYNNAPLPRHDIALNVLEDMGVPSGRTESVYTLILDSAQSVGFLRDLKGKQYVDLTGVEISSTAGGEVDNAGGTQDEEIEEKPVEREVISVTSAKVNTGQANRRVFITHGKNKTFIDPIKKLLGFGELIPVVSVDKQSVSKPVPDKVMDDMRSCGAAIIHVEAEQQLIDKDANEHSVINSNVLIEIGAAMALYGRRFILLVHEGVKMPSNLRGLYEVRYKDDNLDGDTTIRLLEAINDIKNNPLPDRYKSDI